MATHRNHGKPNLQFITATTSSFQRGKLRQDPAVKRHVMLDRRRRERLAAVKEYQQQQRTAVETAAEQSGHESDLQKLEAEAVDGDEFRPEEAFGPGHEEISTPSNSVQLVKQHPAAWSMDPFGSFVAPLDPHMQSALEYYAKVMVPSTRPSDLASQDRHIRKVIQFTLSSDMVLDSVTAVMVIARAMNAYASESKARWTATPDLDEAADQIGSSRPLPFRLTSGAKLRNARGLVAQGLGYMNRAMRKLNEQISKSFEADDQATMTVLEFVVCEILMGEVSKAETHCQGLCAMVRSRGGPDNIPDFLMASIFFSDMHLATMSHRQPSYPLLQAYYSSLETWLPQICATHGLSQYRTERLVLNECLKAYLSDEIVTAIQHLQDIVNYTNSFSKSLTALPVDVRKLYLNKNFAVEHAILSRIEPNPRPKQNTTEDFCIIATMLFIYTSIQKWSPYSPLVRIVVRQLSDALSNSLVDSLLARDPNFLLWSLFLGAYASAGQRTRSRFVTMINIVTWQIGITDWYNAKASLMACFWVDVLFDEDLGLIWLEAARLDRVI